MQDAKFGDGTQRNQAWIGLPQAGEHDDRENCIVAQASEHTTERETVETWHLKVGDETVSAVGQNSRQRRVAVRRRDNVETASEALAR